MGVLTMKEPDPKPNSMVIEKVTWHNGLLMIKFKMNPPRSYDGTWGYSGVPKKIYEEFLKAESKGGYFNRYIRNSYDFVEMK